MVIEKAFNNKILIEFPKTFKYKVDHLERKKKKYQTFPHEFTFSDYPEIYEKKKN